MNQMYVGVGIYLVILLAIGFWAERLTKTKEAYLLGNRRLNYFVAGMSEAASAWSGHLVIGYPGEVFNQGFIATFAFVPQLYTDQLNWIFLAKRLRRYTEYLKTITLPTFFEQRFKDGSHMLRIVAAAIIGVFMTAYVMGQFLAIGKAFGWGFGWGYDVGMLVGALIIIAYTLAGGFLAVCWTDVVQGICMMLFMFTVPALAVSKAGGLGGLVEKLGEMSPAHLTVTGGLTGTPMILAVVGYLAVALGFFGQPHVFVRYMAIDKARDVNKALILVTAFTLIGCWGAPFVGAAGRVLFPALEDPESVTPMIVQSFIPPILGGFVLSFLVSAMMSTADSQLLVAASAISEDIFGILNPRATTRQIVMVSRICVLAMGLFAYLGARSGGSVFWAILYAWAGGGAAFGPLIILSLYWKRVTKWGALAGMLVGTFAVILWKSSGLSQYMYELLPAFVLSGLSIILVSLVTKPPVGTEEEFDEALQLQPRVKKVGEATACASSTPMTEAEIVLKAVRSGRVKPVAVLR